MRGRPGDRGWERMVLVEGSMRDLAGGGWGSAAGGVASGGGLEPAPREGRGVLFLLRPGRAKARPRSF